MRVSVRLVCGAWWRVALTASLEHTDSIRVDARLLFLGISEILLEGLQSQDATWRAVSINGVVLGRE